MMATRSAMERTFGSWVTMTRARFSLFARSRNSSRTWPAGVRVEVRGRLVGEEEGRRAGEGAGDGDPLLLPAREVAREERLPVGEADGVEDALGLPPGGVALHAAAR